MIKKILKIIYNFIRGTIRIIYLTILYLIVFLIAILGNKREDRGKVTIYKIKRIRFLTKFKLFIWHTMPHIMTFLKSDEYLKELDKRLGYGV